MDIEQLDLAEQRPSDDDPARSARIGPLVWVGIALVALVGGFLVLNRGGTAEPDPSPIPTLAVPSRSALPAPPAPAPGPNQRQYLGVTEICGPVTDGRRRLAVSFEVSNVSRFPITVGSVAGVLPQGGLRQRGPATRGGSCEQAGTLAMAGPIPAGESTFYTLTFSLPKTCPARYPVQVRVDFGAAGFDETSLSLLFSDLSVPDFDTCGPGEAQAGTAGWFTRL